MMEKQSVFFSRILQKNDEKNWQKMLRKKVKNAKVAIRNIRRDANDSFKKLKKSADVSEDEMKDWKKSYRNDR